MGRGERSNPFPTFATPGPGAYAIYKDVKDPKTLSKGQDDLDEVQENLNRKNN